jgi:hypothetical protein
LEEREEVMDIEQVVGKYEAEVADIDAKVAALNERKDFVNTVLKEIRSVAGAAAPKATKAKRTRKKAKAATPARATPAPASAPAPAKPARKCRKGSGKPSAREAILQVVGEASEPIAAGEIVEKAAQLSGGKTTSIRTQLNALNKEGKVQPVPFSGRGFKYRLPK